MDLFDGTVLHLQSKKHLFVDCLFDLHIWLFVNHSAFLKNVEIFFKFAYEFNFIDSPQ